MGSYVSTYRIPFQGAIVHSFPIIPSRTVELATLSLTILTPPSHTNETDVKADETENKLHHCREDLLRPSLIRFTITPMGANLSVDQISQWHREK